MKKTILLLAFLLNHIQLQAQENYSADEELNQYLQISIEQKEKALNSLKTVDANTQINFCRYLEEISYIEYTTIDKIHEKLKNCKTIVQETFSEHPKAILYSLEDKYNEEYETVFDELIKTKVDEWEESEKQALFKSTLYKLNNTPKEISFALLLSDENHTFASYSKVIDYFKKKYKSNIPKRQLLKLKNLAKEDYEKKQYLNNYAYLDEDIQSYYETELSQDDIELSLLSKIKYFSATNNLEKIEELFLKNPDDYQLDASLKYLIDNKTLNISPSTRRNFYKQWIDQSWSNDILLFQWVKTVKQSNSNNYLPPLKSIFIALLACLCMILSPMLLIIPIHYIGLIREKYFSLSKPLYPGITLKTLFWFLVIFILLSVFLEEYFLNGEALRNYLDFYSEELPDFISPLYLLSSTVVTFLIAIIVLNKNLIPLLNTKNRSSALKIIIAAVFTTLLMFVLSYLLNSNNLGTSSAQISQYVKEFITEYGYWISLLTIAIIGPIFEELMCRAIILNSLQRHLGFWVANTLQALVFMSIHVDTHLYLYYFGFGFTAGLLYKYTKTMYTPILFHILINAIAVTTMSLGIQANDKEIPSKEVQTPVENCQNYVTGKQYENFLDCYYASELGYAEGTNTTVKFLRSSFMPFDTTAYQLEILNSRQDMDNAESYYLLSVVYGSEEFKDKELRIKNLEISSDKGYSVAQSEFATHLIFSDNKPSSEEIKEGIALYQKAIKQGSSYSRNQLAWFYATTSNERYRDGKKAIDIMQPLLPLEKMPSAWIDTLAAAYAANNDFKNAVLTEEKAIQLFELNEDNQNILDEFHTTYQLFKNNKAIYNPNY